ncbi:MAG: DUF2933 domain-containing protein [Candidatus Diapherotrites archaeon]
MNLGETIARIRENHLLMMAVCCIVPVAFAAMLFVLGFRTYALWLVILLCPLMHLFMMKDMHSAEKKEHSCDKHKSEGD